MNERMVLKVEGMDCVGCEQRLATAVGRVHGVRDATADHTTGTLRVELDPGADRDAVTARVAEAGYTVTGQETRS
ncbi:heavy-metal-associated domain-containing protein [Cumulibacter manganitolerans]|uniref:heavy-metal-associated domain-containing protein n=1 Tax=Cumulibacter manganitolerans TaxID=1884992 RepID=UPI001E611410|nr:heavy metal-associated domain-containing protein [Cumulibacter manganitolerans]